MTRLEANLAAFTAFARKRLRDPELAADAVQTAFARALAKAGQLARGDRLLPWFWQILRNTVLEAGRRGRTAARLGGAHAEADVDALPAAARKNVCACLAGAIDALPEAHAELLRSDLADEPVPAAARRAGVSPASYHVRRHRARAALRTALQQTCRLCAAHGCLDCDCGSPRGGGRNASERSTSRLVNLQSDRPARRSTGRVRRQPPNDPRHGEP